MYPAAASKAYQVLSGIDFLRNVVAKYHITPSDTGIQGATECSLDIVNCTRKNNIRQKHAFTSISTESFWI